MKYKPTIWLFMTSRLKKGLPTCWPREDVKKLLVKAKPIYKDILSRMKGISDNNPMASNITMSFVTISIWLASERKITPDQMSEVMKIALDWKPMKMFCGMIDMNTEKGIRNFGKMMHKNGFYYHFTRCPIAAFCKEYGYEEINPVLCNIDFITMSMMYSRLIRKHTVAEGAGICDYWTVGNKIADPQ